MEVYEVQYDNNNILFTMNCNCSGKVIVERIRECVIANNITNKKIPINEIYTVRCNDCEKECNIIKIRNGE